jgi:hypothetical protein
LANALWLFHSFAKSQRIHLRFWEIPARGDRDRQALEIIKRYATRCKAIDIQYSCICRTSEIVEYLGTLDEVLQLDSLTIGPQGGTCLLIDDGTMSTEHVPPTADIRESLERFSKLKVQPIMLFVDKYPVSASAVFSARLSILEVSVNSYTARIPDIAAWRDILLSAPNLTSVKLLSFGPGLSIQEPDTFGASNPIQLRSLKRLALTGTFVSVAHLFHESTLPSLEVLQLDSCQAKGIPSRLAKFALTSPRLCDVTVSFGASPSDLNAWGEAIMHLPALQMITLTEMEWFWVSILLSPFLTLPDIHIQLQRIWDIHPSSFEKFILIPGIKWTLIDCLKENDVASGDYESP